VLHDLVHALELGVQEVDISASHSVLGSEVSYLTVVDSDPILRWVVRVNSPVLRDGVLGIARISVKVLAELPLDKTNIYRLRDEFLLLWLQRFDVVFGYLD